MFKKLLATFLVLFVGTINVYAVTSDDGHADDIITAGSSDEGYTSVQADVGDSNDGFGDAPTSGGAKPELQPLSNFSDEVQKGIQAVDKAYPKANIIVDGKVNPDAVAASSASASVKAAASAASKPEARKNSNASSGGSGCDYDGQGSITDALENCVGGSKLVGADGTDLKIDGGFKDQLISWIQRLAGFLALGAVFAIVYGALMMTLSAGEDEKLKKAKDIIKWGILGFIAVISAGFLIALVVNVIYSIGG